MNEFLSGMLTSFVACLLCELIIGFDIVTSIGVAIGLLGSYIIANAKSIKKKEDGAK